MRLPHKKKKKKKTPKAHAKAEISSAGVFVNQVSAAEAAPGNSKPAHLFSHKLPWGEGDIAA